MDSVPRDRLLNKLRELGFRHRRDAKRVALWGSSGSRKRVSVPRNPLIPDEAVKSILGQAGCDREEIESFLRQAKA